MSEGPQDWHEIWPTYASIGTDYQDPVPQPDILNPRPPLHRHELQRVRNGSQILSDIRFLKLIAQTPEAQVWLTTARPNGGLGGRNRYACKLLALVDMECIHIQDGVDKMFRDVRPIQHLDHHPNICNVRDVLSISDRQTGFPYTKVLIFSDYCPRSLRGLLAYFPTGLSELVCIEWLRGMAYGLAYLHMNRIAHLDINPSNVFMIWDHQARDWAPKFGDFGESVRFDEDREMRFSAGHTVGTPGYMAPEMSGYDDFDALPCDMYSLGVTWLECLVGGAGMESGVAELREHLRTVCMTEEPHLPDIRWISDEIAYIVFCMTDRSPGGRPTTDDLVNYLWNVVK